MLRIEYKVNLHIKEIFRLLKITSVCKRILKFFELYDIKSIETYRNTVVIYNTGIRFHYSLTAQEIIY